MSGLEITLIVLGLILIAISYVVSEKVTGDEAETKGFLTVEDYEKQKEMEEDVSKRFERLAEEAVERVDASLCKLSNEKIMAVNEYGDMLLDRIDKNHSEVVFLYSMLTDKEKELKQFVTQKEPVTKEEIAKKLEEIKPEEESKLLYSQASKLHKNRKPEEPKEAGDNSHDAIITMLRDGASVLAISKELGIGQGEVQLVANLYAGGGKA